MKKLLNVDGIINYCKLSGSKLYGLWRALKICDLKMMDKET